MAEITKDQVKGPVNSGNIEQIRDVLFGHKVKEYDQVLGDYERRLAKLEGEFGDFQTEARDRLNQLQEDLGGEIRTLVDALDKRLKYLTLTTQEATGKLQQQLQSNNQKQTQDLELLNKSLSSKLAFLKDELDRSRDRLDEEVQALRDQFFEELEKNVAGLQEAKVSRTDLAEILFNLCIKVKGNDSLPSLPGSNSAES